MSQDIVVINLSPTDANYFLLFQRYYHQFKKQIDAGIFEIREGSAILDFDSSGNIGGIKKVLNYNYNKP